MPQYLPATPIISKGSQRTSESKTLTMQFGNGFQQDVPDGINNRVETWDIVYENISLADRNAILNILVLAGSWDLIYWTAPGGVGKSYKMTKEGFTESNLGANRFNLRFKLKQVFNA